MNLEQLVYVSRSIRAIGSVIEVSDILEQATRNNPANNITGALAFTQTHFVQVLEGSHSSLDVLLLRLLLDDRHTGLEILDRIRIESRTFGEWAMISPRMTPDGQRTLTQFLADDRRSLPLYRDLLLVLCAEQSDKAVR